MGFGSSVANSEASQGGVYFEPGIYPVVQVGTLKVMKSRKGDTLFIAEFDILKSEVENRPAGSSASWICNLSKHDAAPGNVKGFLAAAANASPDDVTEDVADSAVSSENPFGGRLLRLEAVQIETRAGNPFTLHRWSSLSDEAQEEADTLREEAGF